MLSQCLQCMFSFACESPVGQYNFFPQTESKLFPISFLSLAKMTSAGGGGGGQGTRLGFGWVCVAQASKFGHHFRKDLQLKGYPVLKNRQVFDTLFHC